VENHDQRESRCFVRAVQDILEFTVAVVDQHNIIPPA
jgi:hypothetical protein